MTPSSMTPLPAAARWPTLDRVLTPLSLSRARGLALVAASLIAAACGGRPIGAGDAGDSGRPDQRRTDAARRDRGGGSEGGGPDAGGINCDPSTAQCEMAPSDCPHGEIHSVTNGCWGPCVHPLLCRPLSCDTARVLCKMTPPVCPTAGTVTVPMVMDGCWGPCVPILLCACDPQGPQTQCPSPAYVCYAFRRTCGPLD